MVSTRFYAVTRRKYNKSVHAHTVTLDISEKKKPMTTDIHLQTT